MVAGILLAASLTLPVCEVVERADRETKTYPGAVNARIQRDTAEAGLAAAEDGSTVRGSSSRRGSRRASASSPTADTRCKGMTVCAAP